MATTFDAPGGLVEGKVALVTGAASGIGRASALLFAREGARVLVSDIDETGGRETASLIEKEGGEADFYPADVSREEQVAQLVEHCVERFGRIDCAHNNAGITGAMGPLQSITLDDWQRVLDVNLTSIFLSMKYEIPRMLELGGSIVNTASGAGLIATPFLSPYCASKHAILGITKTAAVENAQTGIRVNAVLPGSTDTPMLQASMQIAPEVEKMIRSSTPSGRFGEPEEIAEAAVWLASDRSSYVSGHSMLVDAAAVAR
jgi:NAD(P)-dependent dehydrogenase (short-subunit alcohol dehydrogenase family)